MNFTRPSNVKVNFYRTNFINKLNEDFVDAAIRKDDNKYKLLYRELTVKNGVPVKFNDEYLRKRLALRVIKELLNINRTGKLKIFEVGFGHGELLLRLNKMGHITGGSDSNIERANYLKSIMKNISNQSIEKLNPIKEKYDVVICCEVLEHVFDLEGALLKINGLLNENGAFWGTVPYLKKREYVSHVRIFDKSNLSQALVNSGFYVNSIILMSNMMKGKEDILFFWAFKGENHLWKSYM